MPSEIVEDLCPTCGQPRRRELGGGPDKEFAKEDYKLKVEYLTKQYDRMWMRFNLFLTLETGLVALLFVKDSNGWTAVAWAVALVEAVISLMWFAVGLQDRLLVRTYRAHVRDAASQLAHLNSVSAEYRYVGEETRTRRSMRDDPDEKDTWLDRWELKGWLYWHVTRLAYVFPLVALVLWLVVVRFTVSAKLASL